MCKSKRNSQQSQVKTPVILEAGMLANALDDMDANDISFNEPVSTK